MIIEKITELTPISDGVSSGVTRGRKNPLWFGVAQRLKTIREAAGLSILAATNFSGLSYSVWRFAETQQSVPLISSVEQVALAMGVSPCWLAFGDDGEMPFQQKIARAGEDIPATPVPSPAVTLKATAYLGLSARMKAARLAQGISMRELSRRAGLSVQAVSLLENGTGIPRIDNCEALALALDVAPCWLAFGVGRGPALN